MGFAATTGSGRVLNIFLSPVWSSGTKTNLYIGHRLSSNARLSVKALGAGPRLSRAPDYFSH